MLIRLDLMEQRHKAVLEVLAGHPVIQVALRYGVARQTLQRWLRRYARSGIGGLFDKPTAPLTCPHQMSPEVEARLVAMRTEHPGWGPTTLVYQLAKAGVDPVPGRSSVYRLLLRHGLVTHTPRRRKPEDYRRWERSRPMELWQMDVMGGVKLEDGRDLKVVTGLDDHSRFCISAELVRRATARPVCEALAEAMRRHGVPDQVLIRQRQGVHREVRTGDRGGALRPDLAGERGPPSAHRSPLAHHHRQGGALPQDRAPGVPPRPRLRLPRGGPRGARRLGLLL